MKTSICAAALALAACSSGQSATENTAEPVALVKLAAASPASVQSSVALYGTAEAGAAGSAILSAPTEAVVAAIVAPTGSAVSRGQLVVRLAPSAAARLDLVKAASDARAAQLAYERAQRLRADGLVSNAEVDTARATAQAATATRASLAARSGALELRAPIAGHVQTVSATLGSLVPAGTSVATIMAGGDLRGRFGVDPALVRQIRPGTGIRVAPSAGGPSFAATVLSVDPTVDAQTRLASLFVRIPAAAAIGAGQPLTGQLALAAGDGAPTVPYAALLDDAGQAYVFIVSGGKAHRRNVTPGPSDGERVVISRGLKSGEQVVVEGGTALDDGMKVRTR
ncbi:efflux RND transporter periplasmic adaptor subunit [Sphingomonas sp. ID1715]|uniref:efflux RND transporter periplasmic adaptor subunit n=1 Tax=Sphingomonas sp. ID1715 TaxID=1656898 RepID=UPI001489C5CD|nr:efflux RND transporter periplasmic adaptor subunit [Sphingomonas sp. ID1715]NNM77738.1 efflux RND transporter periplasmic adaptor subunit [Sphingomonas sp. ID1715]